MALDPSIILGGQPSPFNPTQALGQAMQLRGLGQEQQLRSAQIEDVKAQTQERQQQAMKAAAVQKQNDAISGLMQNALKVDPDTGVATFDRSLFEHGLIQSGMGNRYPEISQTLDKLDESANKIAGEKRSLLARSIFAVQQAGNTPEAVQTAGAYLKANKAITDDHLQPVLASIADDPSPQNIDAMMTKLGATIPEYHDLVNSEEKRKSDLAHTAAETAKAEAEAKKALGETNAPAKPPTAPELEARAQVLYAKRDLFDKKMGPPLSAVEASELKGYEDARHNPDVAAAAAAAKDDAQSNRDLQQKTSSYQFHTEQLKPIASPIEQKQGEIANMYTLLNQHNPQADADVAPKMLALFAGGTGSGLRMNKDLIERNAGGHTAWVGLQQTLNSFSSDPNHATIPEEQRQQIYKLLGAAQGQVQGKLDAIHQYQGVLVDPNASVSDHRKGFVELQSKISKLESDVGASGGSAPAATAPKAPQGWKYVPKKGGGWTAVPDSSGR